MDYVEALLELVPPKDVPASNLTPLDFGEAERKLQVPIPEDYQRILQTYRSGSFDEFLWLYSPFSKNQYMNLFEHLAIENELLEQWFETEPCDIELWPSPEGLIPWAGTANGDLIYWRTIKHEIQIVVRETRSLNFQIFPLSISEFLVNALIEKLEVNCFPYDLPEDPFFLYESYD
ncbi:MAG: SMI1/KNR4 family protein [Planctomycetaceae bacterium]|nr:SMI1/KNR4 family protein [Planctomycetaceae bacterium]